MARFLISRLSSLGDVACTLPVASALKAGFEDAHVTWVVDPRFAGLVECCSAVDEVVKAKPSWSRSSVPSFEEPFEAALDMQGLLKSAIVVHRAKAKRKLGYHWQREGAWLFSQRVLPDPSSVHIVDQYVDVGRAAGGKADSAEFSLVPLPEDLSSVGSKLRERGIEHRFVVLNAGAGWSTKRWPPQHFAAVCDGLNREGVRPVLIGGKAQADQEAAAEVISRVNAPVVSLLGETSVRELVALISLASAHVGGDTGSTHIAAALSKPAIGLYSITRPERSCPYRQIERCQYHPEGLAYIHPEDVLRVVKEAIA